MPDVLIRNFPAEDLALLDEHAVRYGISRVEFIRRHLQQEARGSITAVTVADLHTFAQNPADRADKNVMDDAWS